MMFIPNEPAYIAAMRIEPTIWQEAYDNKVLIVSPTHLVSGLRLIAQLWSRDKYTKNVGKGNLVSRAQKMHALGVKASKQLSASTLNSVDDSFQED